MTSKPLHASGRAERLPSQARYYVAGAVVTLVLVAVAYLAPATIGGETNPLFSEDGYVENLSAIGYLGCILLLAAFGKPAMAGRTIFALSVLLLGLALREMDFHARFTAMSVEKTRFFVSHDVPAYQKAIVVVVYGLLAAAAIQVAITFYRGFVREGKRIHAVIAAVLASGFLIAFSKSLDGVGRTASKLGFAVSEHGVQVFQKIEETAELGVPAFAIIGILAYVGLSRSVGDRTV